MTHHDAIAGDLFHPDLVIRRAGADDQAAVRALARLDDARPLGGEVLIAEVDGELWAALSLEDGRGLAHPFQHSASALELLRIRASHLARVWRERAAA